MLFNSIEFVFFFPIVTLFYFLLSQPYRVIFLLLASCVFYMAFVPKYLLILLATIGIDYAAGLALEKSPSRQSSDSRRQHRVRKLVLGASLVANLGILFLFKYYNFFNDNIAQLAHGLGLSWSLPALKWALPMGLSFHTFQAMAYTVEVYYGRQKAERNLAIYALYVLFYPQLVAGPIERPQNLLPQLHKHYSFNWATAASGLRLMFWGFFKKIVIADRLTVLVDAVYAQPAGYSGPIIVLAILFFSFQIYCDFSGYTDIALGAARVMGIDLMKNFNQPYLSSSVTEFWTRWHISLSSWFRDYLYIPLGGNRLGKFRTYFNLGWVFLVSGLWHGAQWTFVIWGALHGIWVAAEKWAARGGKSIPMGAPVTFLAVSIAWVFFRASSLPNAYDLFEELFRNWNWSTQGQALRQLAKQGFTLWDLSVSIILCAMLIISEAMSQKISFNVKMNQFKAPYRWLIYYAGFLAILFLGKFTRERFIYFQF